MHDLQVTTNYGMKYANEVQIMVKAGEERPVQRLLEQWLRERKMEENEAVMTNEYVHRWSGLSECLMMNSDEGHAQ